MQFRAPLPVKKSRPFVAYSFLDLITRLLRLSTACTLPCAFQHRLRHAAPRFARLLPFPRCVKEHIMSVPRLGRGPFRGDNGIRTHDLRLAKPPL
jgi:hypothetical protein